IRIEFVLAASWPMLPASVVLAASLALVASADAAVAYTVIDLGTLGGSSSRGLGINSTGVVAGSSQTTGNAATHGFYFDPGAPELHDLGTLGGTNSFAEAAGGQIVGYSNTATAGVVRAFSYTGTMIDLGTLGGPSSHAFGLNASGHIAGDAETTLMDPGGKTT